MPCRTTSIPFRLATLALLSAGTAAELRAQETTHPIGAVGSTLVLGPAWKRVGAPTSPEVSRWVRAEPGTGEQALEPIELELREHQTCIENPADARRVLDTLFAEGHDVELERSSVAGLSRATRSFTSRIGGIERSALLVLASGDALAYSIAGYAPSARRSALHAAADELLRGLRWPAEDSAWRRDLLPVERRVMVGTHELAFLVRPAALREVKPTGGEVFRAVTADESQGFVVEIGIHSDQMMEIRRVGEWLRAGEPDLVRGTPRPTRVQAFDATIVELRSSRRTHHLMLLVIDAELAILLRYWSPGQPEDARAERERCFASLRCDPLSSELPPFPEETRVLRVEHAPLLRELLSRSELLARAPRKEYSSVERVAPRTWLLESFGSSLILEPSGTRPIPGSDSFMSKHVRWRGRWITTRDGGAPMPPPTADEEGAALPIPAAWLHAVGEDLLIARWSPSDPLIGLEPQYGGRSSTILRQRPGGAEERIAELRDAQVRRMQADRSGQHLALHVVRRGRQLGEEYSALTILDLGSGELRSLGIWSEIRCFGPAPRGWLVTGRPPGEPYGVWQVVDGEPRRLLLASREILGVALDDELLEFGLDTTAGYELHGIELAICTQLGARIEPFAPEDLELLGERMLTVCSAPGTAREIDQVIARVQTHARELRAADLPTSARECDRLVQSMFFAGGLDVPGRALCTLLTMRALLSRGAVWIDEPEPTWAAWVGPGADDASTAFDLPLLAPNSARLTFDRSEGYDWPCSHWQGKARGRTILLGLSAERLRRATAERVPSGFAAALENVDVPALLALLREHERNYCLRERIYEHLALRGETAAVLALARPFSSRSRGAAEAEIWALAQELQTPAEAAELIDRALAVLRRHPESDVANYHLGAACERADPPRLELARAARRSWSVVGRAASAALERWKR